MISLAARVVFRDRPAACRYTPHAHPLSETAATSRRITGKRAQFKELSSAGSVLECGAIQDVLVVGKALDEQESLVRKTELDRMAAMLSRLGGRVYCVAENSVPYGTKPEKVDPDPDFDFYS
jgi:hypothetical protein